MVNFNKVRGGLYAKKVGAGFEDRFEKYCYHAENVSCIRLPDGCKRVGANQFIPVRTAFDWIVFHRDTVIFCDTKTTNTNSYSINEGKVAFQLENFRICDSHNHIAGFLVEYRDINELRWFGHKRITEILKEKKSLRSDEGLLVGSSVLPMSIDFEKIVNEAASHTPV